MLHIYCKINRIAKDAWDDSKIWFIWLSKTAPVTIFFWCAVSRSVVKQDGFRLIYTCLMWPFRNWLHHHYCFGWLLVRIPQFDFPMGFGQFGWTKEKKKRTFGHWFWIFLSDARQFSYFNYIRFERKTFEILGIYEQIEQIRISSLLHLLLHPTSGILKEKILR